MILVFIARGEEGKWGRKGLPLRAAGFYLISGTNINLQGVAHYNCILSALVEITTAGDKKRQKRSSDPEGCAEMHTRLSITPGGKAGTYMLHDTEDRESTRMSQRVSLSPSHTNGH